MNRLLTLTAILWALPAFATWGNGYTYKTTATIAAAQVTGTLTTFPALISLSSANLKTVGNSGSIQHTCTQGGSYNTTIPADFFVTSDSAGATQITGVEFESYSASAGTALVWVNVASAATSTVVYIWYGNGAVSTCQGTVANTWNSAYLAVWHFPNGATVSGVDSTTNAKTLTITSTSATASGEIDGASIQNNTASVMTHAAILDASSADFTYEAWIKTAGTSNQQMLNFVTGSTNRGGIGINSLTLTCSYYNGTNFPISDSATIATGTWIYAACTKLAGGHTPILYKNATSVSGGSGSVNGGSTANFTIGLDTDGDIGGSQTVNTDEVRISNTVRTAAWITATYNNQSAPGTFWTIVYDATNATAVVPRRR